VPDAIVSEGPDPRAAADYSAQELACRRGDRLTSDRFLNGWRWCRAEDGAEGWLPSRVLKGVGRT